MLLLLHEKIFLKRNFLLSGMTTESDTKKVKSLEKENEQLRLVLESMKNSPLIVGQVQKVLKDGLKCRARLSRAESRAKTPVSAGDKPRTLQENGPILSI